MARMEGVQPRAATWTARFLMRAIAKRTGRLSETWPIVAHVPRLLRGWSLWELHLDGARSVAPGLKKLAELKVAAMVGCPS